MSAHEQMRQMLDQLMGTGRDGENNRYKVHFTDPKVCKSFLLACCPHDILQSTRMDLGECPKYHDLALRADYESANSKKDYYYDVDAMEHLQNFINDCDRRTEQAKKRLAETQEELSSEVTQKLNKVHELAENIGKKLAQAEALGADGNVEESLKLMEEVEEIRKSKAQAEISIMFSTGTLNHPNSSGFFLESNQDYRNSMPASSYQQQKLRVCEVCSAYLGIHDNDRRLADHFGGKLHLGFITIREKLEELKTGMTERREKGRLERDKEFERERLERHTERSRMSNWNPGPRERSGSRGRVRQRSCSPSKDYLPQRSRSRSRSSSRRRSRSRSPSSHSPSSHSSSRQSYSSSRDRHHRHRDERSHRSRNYDHHRGSREHRHSRHSRDRSP